MRKTAAVVLVTAAVVALSGCGAAQARREILPEQMGVSLGWVGSYPGNRLQEGARLAKQSGFQTINLPLVASVGTDFNTGASCDAGRRLADLAALPAYSGVLGDPAFHMIILTIWGDPNSYDACQPRNPRSYQHPGKRYLTKDFYAVASNRDGLRDQYADLTYQLHRAYRGTGKVFAISNWEGDNELYCDAAWYYVRLPDFRASCDAKRKTADVFEAYRQFFTLRQAGIDAGKARATREGLQGVSVVSMIEVNSFHFLKQYHQPSVIDDLLPSIPAPDYVSYSAWESIGGGIPEDQLFRDVSEFSDRFPGKFIVGEFGFDRGAVKDAAERATKALRDMQRAHIERSIWWQIFDQPPVLDLGDTGLYGLYDRDEKLTETGRRFIREFLQKVSTASR